MASSSRLFDSTQRLCFEAFPTCPEELLTQQKRRAAACSDNGTTWQLIIDERYVWGIRDSRHTNSRTTRRRANLADKYTYGPLSCLHCASCSAYREQFGPICTKSAGAYAAGTCTVPRAGSPLRPNGQGHSTQREVIDDSNHIRAFNRSSLGWLAFEANVSWIQSNTKDEGLGDSLDSAHIGTSKQRSHFPASSYERQLIPTTEKTPRSVAHQSNLFFVGVHPV